MQLISIRMGPIKPQQEQNTRQATNKKYVIETMFILINFITYRFFEEIGWSKKINWNASIAIDYFY